MIVTICCCHGLRGLQAILVSLIYLSFLWIFFFPSALRQSALCVCVSIHWWEDKVFVTNVIKKEEIIQTIINNWNSCIVWRTCCNIAAVNYVKSTAHVSQTPPNRPSDGSPAPGRGWRQDLAVGGRGAIFLTCVMETTSINWGPVARWAPLHKGALQLVFSPMIDGRFRVSCHSDRNFLCLDDARARLGCRSWIKMRWCHVALSP